MELNMLEHGSLSEALLLVEPQLLKNPRRHSNVRSAFDNGDNKVALYWNLDMIRAVVGRRGQRHGRHIARIRVQLGQREQKAQLVDAADDDPPAAAPGHEAEEQAFARVRLDHGP
ncbi:hypothetical protein OCS_06363 [Ophiocordyceps sinensis CO18]|uniref:Uncharacterized protein n=1 Tax=Ophiocordyceps sinensis (strain Co18 / CGMCC 3.14243) TaxID=911162 RepID=T5A845_OPHSC|nr:hypothetical protein OCS_06363 [Ophiocordyceps sinensis CO18]